MHITTAAIDSYRYHHGGSIESARRELRDMLVAFAAEATARSAGGYIGLVRDGYKLILNAELDVLTGYHTVQRERTWAQLQAGVASRFPGGGSKGSPGAPLKEPAEHRPMTCDPQTVALKPRHLRAFAVRMHLQHLAHAELEGARRRFIGETLVEQPGAVRRDDSVEFTHGDVRIIFSADQQKVLTVSWPRRPGLEPRRLNHRAATSFARDNAATHRIVSGAAGAEPGAVGQVASEKPAVPTGCH